MDSDCTTSLYEVKEETGLKPWPTREISGVTTISAKIGPTGGKRGYTPITGHPSWGIAWYLNDLLIPELVVERGQTYTFIVEGGDKPAQPAKYHPFYITDSSEGGYGQKTDAEQKRQIVYAGVEFDSEDYPVPTAGKNLKLKFFLTLLKLYNLIVLYSYYRILSKRFGIITIIEFYMS